MEWSVYPTVPKLWDSTLDFVLIAKGKDVVLAEVLAYYFELPMVP